MEIGEGEGRAERAGAVLGWSFMEEEEEPVNNADPTVGRIDTTVAEV